MSSTVCLVANTLTYLEGGGHLWLPQLGPGLRALDCHVVWLEVVRPDTSPDALRTFVATLKDRLQRYGLADSVALCSLAEPSLPLRVEGCLDLDAASEADLLLNFVYGLPREVVQHFRRTALVDIDPGLLQIWVHRQEIFIAPHDIYFTIGETVGHPDSGFPDSGVPWTYTPPPVALSWWPPTSPATSPSPSFTTVSHWDANEWVEWGGKVWRNDKRAGFLPFLNLPQRTPWPLELALCIRSDDEDWAELLRNGWRIRHAWNVTSTPWDYQHTSRVPSGNSAVRSLHILACGPRGSAIARCAIWPVANRLSSSTRGRAGFYRMTAACFGFVPWRMRPTAWRQ